MSVRALMRQRQVKFGGATRRGTWPERLAAALEGVLDDDQPHVAREAQRLLDEYRLETDS